MNLEQFAQNTTPQLITTRLGPILWTMENQYSFDEGLIGFGAVHKYIISPMEDIPSELNFYLLHGIEGNDLTFIMKRFDFHKVGEGEVYASSLLEWIKIHGLDIQNCFVGLLVIINDGKNAGERVVYNHLAPLIFDTKSQKGWQVVLSEIE
jgi:flagellar assembly factor FliW